MKIISIITLGLLLCCTTLYAQIEVRISPIPLASTLSGIINNENNLYKEKLNYENYSYENQICVSVLAAQFINKKNYVLRFNWLLIESIYNFRFPIQEATPSNISEYENKVTWIDYNDARKGNKLRICLAKEFKISKKTYFQLGIATNIYSTLKSEEKHYKRYINIYDKTVEFDRFGDERSVQYNKFEKIEAISHINPLFSFSTGFWTSIGFDFKPLTFELFLSYAQNLPVKNTIYSTVYSHDAITETKYTYWQNGDGDYTFGLSLFYNLNNK